MWVGSQYLICGTRWAPVLATFRVNEPFCCRFRSNGQRLLLLLAGVPAAKCKRSGEEHGRCDDSRQDNQGATVRTRHRG